MEKKRISFIIVFLLLRSLHLNSQVKDPGQPYTPEINNNIDLQIFKVKARITIQGRSGLIEGEMVLNSDVLTTPGNMILKISDISKINILMWEKRSRMNRHTFYPSRYEIIFRDYRKVIINGNIDLLNKVKISKKKVSYIFLYYYDYYKQGKWIISGIQDFDAFSLKPADGCAVSIELIQ